MGKSLFRTENFELSLDWHQKRFYIGIVLAVLSLAALRRTGGSLPASCLFPVLLGGLSVLRIRCGERTAAVLNFLWMAAAVPALFFLPQFLLEMRVSYISMFHRILGLLIVLAVILFLYLCTGNPRVTVILATVLLMSLAIADYYVISFRGDELSPTDFLAIGTAMNVASGYEFSVTATMVYTISFCVVLCFCGFCIPGYRRKRKKKRLLILAVAEAVLLLGISIGIREVPVLVFMATGSQLNGFYVSFCSKLSSVMIQRPEGYGQEEISGLEDEYSENAGGTTGKEKERQPDIIVIMGEAFADLRKVGELRTDSEVMPFFDSLEENTIRGYALSSVFGGGTCNSEFEALTGHSMANLPGDSFPYQQYIKEDTYSMASYLKEQGYSTLATHPETGANWRRNAAYPYLGFEQMRFLEEYSGNERIRGHVSDLGMYRQMISWYEEQKGETPLFYFGVTMQNHSPFGDDEEYPSTVHLEGYSKEYPDAEQYLTLIQESDRALEYLIRYFETVENEVVVVFFGDHMPQLELAFYQELNGGPLDNLQDSMKRYEIPFFIWTNYEIEEQSIECTSLNYLPNLIYEAAGLELPPYQQFLEDLREQIPAVNALGYYSDEKDAFAAFEDAVGEEASLLEQYRCLQYNALFDKRNKSEIFFKSR